MDDTALAGAAAGAQLDIAFIDGPTDPSHTAAVSFLFPARELVLIDPLPE